MKNTPFLQSSPTANLCAAAQNLLSLLGVRVTQTALKEELENHPNYPSLYALADSLHTWQIENISIDLPQEELGEISFPAVAQFAKNNGYFVVIQDFKENIVSYIDPAKGYVQEAFTDFCKHWTGIILMAEPNEASGEQDYAEKRKQEIISSFRLPFVLFSAFIFVMYGFYFAFDENTSWNILALAAVKLAGLGVSVLLLWYQIDKGNAFVKNLCQLNKKTNCDSILSSKAANLFSWLSWSEIGFFYFSGTLIATLSNAPLRVQTLSMLSILTLLALPYTFYSLYYQVFKAKQYCTLCLTVVGLLWVEFLIGYSYFQNINFEFTFNHIVQLILCFLLPITLWVFIKPFLVSSLEVKPLKAQLRKFKNNPDLFSRLLGSQPAMPYLPSGLAVEIGNKDAENTLTIITNPFCPPCAKAHAEIEKLIEGKANLNCQIIFTATNEETDSRGEVARHIFSLAESQRAEALHAWYLSEEKDTKKWKGLFANVKYQEKDVEHLIDQHNAWCGSANITQTPTLYLNGYRLPEVYQIADLKYLINSDLAKSTII